jgi:Fur family transcriptional regulator, ferric uptake regulator
MNARSRSPAHQPQALPALAERLRRQSRKITGPRKAILDILRRQPHPLTTREILAAMPRSQCDLATIYRAMHLLAELRMVKQYDFGDGVARFELVGDDNGGHHHHLVCTRCAQVVEIQECFSDEIERRIAVKNGFQSVTHKLEFFGICPDCQ